MDEATVDGPAGGGSKQRGTAAAASKTLMRVISARGAGTRGGRHPGLPRQGGLTARSLMQRQPKQPVPGSFGHCSRRSELFAIDDDKKDETGTGFGLDCDEGDEEEFGAVADGGAADFPTASASIGQLFGSHCGGGGGGSGSSATLQEISVSSFLQQQQHLDESSMLHSSFYGSREEIEKLLPQAIQLLCRPRLSQLKAQASPPPALSAAGPRNSTTPLTLTPAMLGFANDLAEAWRDAGGGSGGKAVHFPVTDAAAATVTPAWPADPVRERMLLMTDFSEDEEIIAGPEPPRQQRHLSPQPPPMLHQPLRRRSSSSSSSIPWPVQRLPLQKNKQQQPQQQLQQRKMQQQQLQQQQLQEQQLQQQQLQEQQLQQQQLQQEQQQQLQLQQEQQQQLQLQQEQQQQLQLQKEQQQQLQLQKEQQLQLQLQQEQLQQIQLQRQQQLQQQQEQVLLLLHNQQKQQQQQQLQNQQKQPKQQRQLEQNLPSNLFLSSRPPVPKPRICHQAAPAQPTHRSPPTPLLPPQSPHSPLKSLSPPGWSAEQTPVPRVRRLQAPPLPPPSPPPSPPPPVRKERHPIPAAPASTNDADLANDAAPAFDENDCEDDNATVRPEFLDRALERLLQTRMQLTLRGDGSGCGASGDPEQLASTPGTGMAVSAGAWGCDISSSLTTARRTAPSFCSPARGAAGATVIAVTSGPTQMGAGGASAIRKLPVLAAALAAPPVVRR